MSIRRWRTIASTRGSQAWCRGSCGLAVRGPDDPWADRQTPLPERDFTRLLRDGVPFSRPPAMAMEYSNLGYALLGRIVTNVSGRSYKDFVQRLLFMPLG